MQNPFQHAGSSSAESQDPLAFVKKLWGDMQLPGMVTPNLSLNDLDKQIQDLKTVESWLQLNMNMLRGSIQALEVQRATIAALKTMGESFTKAANNAAPSSPHASWPMPDQAKTNGAGFHSELDPLLAENEEVEEDDASSVEAGTSAPAVNPAAWWTVLQDQFKQALQTAMQAEKAESMPVSPKAAASKSRSQLKKASATPATKAKSKTAKAAVKPSAVRAKPKSKAVSRQPK